MPTLQELTDSLLTTDLNYSALATQSRAISLADIEYLIGIAKPALAARAVYLLGYLLMQTDREAKTDDEDRQSAAERVLLKAADHTDARVRSAAATAAQGLSDEGMCRVVAWLAGDCDLGVRLHALNTATVRPNPLLARELRALQEAEPEPILRLLLDKAICEAERVMAVVR